MKERSPKTLAKYGMTREEFVALYEAQGGCCGICGISEDELSSQTAPDAWASDRVLHIDHEHGQRPWRIRGQLCPACNYYLEAHIRQAPVRHPGGRGRSTPRSDPRFDRYLARFKSAG
jgi:hypothetical protein